MKKAICIVSTAILILTLATACGKTVQTESETETETQTISVPPFSEVDGVKSRKVEIDDTHYEIDILDGNGNASKREFYKDGILTYYIEVSAKDADGNSTQEKYYTSKKELFATCDSGNYYDKNGKQISEEVMAAAIDKYNK